MHLKGGIRYIEYTKMIGIHIVKMYCILIDVYCFSELACGCHEHIGMEVLNDIFHISADTMFENLFTDSKFMNDFMTKRKTTGKLITLHLLLFFFLHVL